MPQLTAANQRTKITIFDEQIEKNFALQVFAKRTPDNDLYFRLENIIKKCLSDNNYHGLAHK